MAIRAGNIAQISRKERSSLKFLEYSKEKDTIVSTKDIGTTGLSTLGVNHSIYNGGENVFFTNRKSGISWSPIWGGTKDQSILANQNISGIIQATERLYSNTLILEERNGAASIGTVAYGESFTPNVESAFYYVKTQIKMPLVAGNILHYHIFYGEDLVNLYFEFHQLVESDMAVNDYLEMWLPTPYEVKENVQYTTQLVVETFLNSGVYQPLLVTESVTSGHHWAIFGYRTFSDAPIFSGHDMTPIEVYTSRSIDRYGQYGIDTTAGNITLTLDTTYGLNSFVIFDLNETLSVQNKLIIDFGGITLDVTAKDSSYLFYKKDNQWKYLIYGYKKAFVVPGF